MGNYVYLESNDGAEPLLLMSFKRYLPYVEFCDLFYEAQANSMYIQAADGDAEEEQNNNKDL